MFGLSHYSRALLWGLLCFFVISEAMSPWALAVAAPPAAAASPRLALLVGVSRYPQAGEHSWNPLHTHDDLIALRKVLVEKHGFAPRDVLVLEDGQATGAAIRAAFRDHLIKQARRGAVIFFHFSGHGQQVRDRDGDENDGLDESIVPVESTDQHAEFGERVNIRDDEFKTWLQALSQRMRDPKFPSSRVDGSIVLSFDSCFSGSMARGDLIERGHGWDKSLDGQRPTERSAATAQPIFDLALSDYIVLSAAQSDQTAKERDGMGVYSRALAGALTRLPIDATYQELMHEISAEVLTAVKNQNPSLEGDASQGLFGCVMSRDGKSHPYLDVLEVRENEVRVPVGKLHLATLGSVYALHHRGGGPMTSQTLLAEAQAFQIEPTTSWLRLGPAWQGKVSTADLRTARVIEKEHVFAESPLRVRMEGLAAQPALVAAVKKLNVVADAGPGQSDYEIKLIARNGALEMLRPDSKEPVASFPSGPQAEFSLLSRLRAEWRWHRLHDLRGLSPWVQASLRIVPINAHRNAAHQIVDMQPNLALAGSRVRMREGESYMLEVTNPSPGPVWIAVMELAPDGAIQALFPAPGRPQDGQFTPGPARLIPVPYIYDVTAPKGIYILKVLVTADRVDFGALVQEAATLTPKNAQERASALLSAAHFNPLGRMLLEAASGNLARSAKAAVEIGMWSATEVYLEVP